MRSTRPAFLTKLIPVVVITISISFSGCFLAWADHAQFTSSQLFNANSWPGDPNDAGIYGQGFTPSLDVIPDPNHSPLDLVGLDRFTFFKDGNTDAASNIKLAIVDNFYLDLAGLTTSRSEFVGISTNTIATTAGLSVGDGYTFEFASLQLEYGSDYGALFVNDDGFGNLTPIKVSALTADYAETPPSSGLFLPKSNYGGEFDFQYSTSNFINSNQFGDFLFGFSEGGDAKFEAVFDLDDPRDTDFEFESSFLNNANTWAGDPNDPGIYGQGFRPALEASQAGHLATDTVGLDHFSFFKDGRMDGQTDIKLAIIDDMFMDLDGLKTSSGGVVGVSSNTISSTAGLSLGDEYTFDFGGLELNYIDDYAAIFVNEDPNGNLTPIKVSALIVDYEETDPNSGIFAPAANYGEQGDFQYAASSALDMPGVGSFLISFADGGDAKFRAVFDTAGIDGDFNGDGRADGLDFLEWQRDPNVGLLSDWETNYGTPIASAVAPVPEPGSCVLLGTVVLAHLSLRRRIDNK